MTDMGEMGMLPSDAFTTRWRRRSSEKQRARVSFGQFALAIPEPDVGRLSMERMPFQREIYLETGDLYELIINKGTQVGMTTSFVRWALWVANELSGRVLYVMPTKEVAEDFSDDRVKPLMEQDALMDKIPPGGTQNKGMKRIGRGIVYFRGSVATSSLDSIPARALVLDEYDELDQSNIPVVERRVDAQDDPLIRRLGVPTLQGYGIDKLYRTTDMRRWLIKCDRCNEWQRITWENVRWEEVGPAAYHAWRVCVHCEESIEQLLRSGVGEWVAEHPDRTRRGYHIPRLIVPNTDVAKMVENALSGDEEKIKNHYNRDRAEPFETPEQRLSEAAIESCRRPGLNYAESYVGFNAVTMGIDQAASRPLNVRISEHLSPTEKRVLAHLEIPIMPPIAGAGEGDPDAVLDKTALRRLAELMQIYRVHMACIDHLPDGVFARTFCAMFPGRAYMVNFNTSPTAKQSIVVPDRNKLAEMLVTVARSEWIGITLDHFRHQRNLIPREQPLPKDYIEQLRNVVKERHQDTAQREFYKYIEAGPVDWLMCELYDCVATEVLKRRMMEGMVMGATAPEEILPDNPTPDFNNYDEVPGTTPLGEGEPLSSYGDGWDSEYRP